MPDMPTGQLIRLDRIDRKRVYEIAEELGTDAKITGFIGVVEHDYIEDDVFHLELNSCSRSPSPTQSQSAGKQGRTLEVLLAAA